MAEITKTIFTDVIITGTIATMDLIRNLYPDTKMKNKEEMDAEIKNKLNDPFPKQLLEIKRLIKEQSFQSGNNIRLNLQDSKLLTDLEEMRSKLEAVNLKYENFMENRDESTWIAFNNISEKEDLELATHWLYILNTEPKVHHDWESMAEKLSKICNLDPEEYKKWQLEICENFAEAYSLRTVYHYYHVFPSERYEGAGDSVKVDIETAYRQLEKMNRGHREVLEAMQQTYHRLVANFLLKKCGDPDHQHCGFKDGSCCELTAKVYQTLRKETSLSTERVAEKIVLDLRESYKQFQWSVVVLEDDRLPELILNFDRMKSVWMQRYGSKSPPGLVKGFLNESLRESYVISEGFSSYGCLLCYRMRPTSQKSALVFWADLKALQTPKMVEARKNLQETWQTDENLKALTGQDGAGGVYRSIGKILERDMNFLFGIGFRQKFDDSKISFKLFQDECGEFPIRLANGNNSTLIWPEV
jgi:hypothetical protein